MPPIADTKSKARADVQDVFNESNFLSPQYARLYCSPTDQFVKMEENIVH